MATRILKQTTRLAMAPRSSHVLLARSTTVRRLQPHAPAMAARFLSSDAGASSSEKKLDQEKPADTAGEAAAETAAEEPVAEGEGEAEASAEEQLQARVTELEGEVEKKHDQMLRALAEADNARRRAAIDVENAKKFAVGKFAKSLLDVADNLSRAAEYVPEELRDNDEHAALKSLYEGVVMTEKTLLKTFEEHGMVRQWPMDEKFDPNVHNALFEMPDPTKEAGTIAHVASAGFVLHDRVIRAAGVGVVKAA